MNDNSNNAKALKCVISSTKDAHLLVTFAVLGCFSCIPCNDKSHAMSSEVCIQICCLFKVFSTHLTGQCSLLFLPLTCGGLTGWRSWCRPVQRTPFIEVLDITRGGRCVHTDGLLAVTFSHFVGDEAMAGQGGGGCEAGAAL